MLDSLKYTKKLETSGLPRNQAEAHIQVLFEVIGDEMATKTDFELLNQSTAKDFESFRATTTKDFEKFKVTSTKDFELFRQEMKGKFKAFTTEIKNEFETFKQEVRSEFEVFKAEMRGEFKAFRAEMRSEFDAFRQEMKREFATKQDLENLKEELKLFIVKEIKASEQRMLISMGKLMAAMFAVALTVQQLLN